MRKYQNEFIVLVALALMIAAFVYKQMQVNAKVVDAAKMEQSLMETKQTVSLLKVWKDKKVRKKIVKLKEIVAPSKVKWRKKTSKLTASYKALSVSELNRLISKLLSMAVQIQKLEIDKVGSSYNVELKCKWQ